MALRHPNARYVGAANLQGIVTTLDSVRAAARELRFEDDSPAIIGKIRNLEESK
jgi:hypothetical protein